MTVCISVLLCPAAGSFWQRVSA